MLKWSYSPLWLEITKRNKARRSGDWRVKPLQQGQIKEKNYFHKEKKSKNSLLVGYK